MGVRGRLGAASREGGAALLSILLIVAAMSVAALVTLDALARSVSTAKAMALRGEAHWTSAAAEAVATSALTELLARTDGALTVQTPGLGAPFVYPIDGGEVRLVITEASNCFNLNSLVAPDERGGWMASDAGVARYLDLLVARGLFLVEAQPLADSLTDWIDSDTVPRSQGAEDAYYLGREPAYRTAGALLENMSELNAVAGYTPEFVEALAEHACVRPNTTPGALNANTLRLEDAPLLAALFSDAMEPETAAQLIARRPPGGWVQMEDLLERPEIAEIAPDKRDDAVLSLQSSYFTVEGRVVIGELERRFEALYEAGEAGAPRIVWRRRGAV